MPFLNLFHGVFTVNNLPWHLKHAEGNTCNSSAALTCSYTDTYLHISSRRTLGAAPEPSGVASATPPPVIGSYRDTAVTFTLVPQSRQEVVMRNTCLNKSLPHPNANMPHLAGKSP